VPYTTFTLRITAPDGDVVIQHVDFYASVHTAFTHISSPYIRRCTQHAAQIEPVARFVRHVKVVLPSVAVNPIILCPLTTTVSSI